MKERRRVGGRLLKTGKLSQTAIAQRLGVDANAFAIFTALKPIHADLVAAQAQDLNAHFARFPDYRWNDGQEKQLRAELYRALRPIVGADTLKIVQAANTILKLERV